MADQHRPANTTTIRTTPQRRRRTALPPGSPSACSSTSPASDSSKDVVALTSFIREEGFLDFLYEPHTLSGLVLLVAILIWTAFWSDHSNTVENVKAGLGLAALTFVAYGALQFRDGMMIRPHPVWWRMVHATAVIYLMVCVFMLMQSLEDARGILALIDPALSATLPERSYGSDCRVFTPDHATSAVANLRDAVHDEFMLAHFLGWFAKALILRDFGLLMFCSFIFEVLEVTLQHLMPNFNECWWDHVGLDMLFCNLIGSALGMVAVHFMEGRVYNWVGIHSIPTLRGKASRVFQQLLPASWTRYDWRMFSSVTRFTKIMLAVVVLNAGDLNSFFLKRVLHIPPPHPINTVRIMVWGFLAMPAVREWYEWVHNPKLRRLGQNVWLLVALLCVEILLIVKWSAGQYPNVWPSPFIVNSWTAFLVLLFLWMFLFYLPHSPAPTAATTAAAATAAASDEPAAAASATATGDGSGSEEEEGEGDSDGGDSGYISGASGVAEEEEGDGLGDAYSLSPAPASAQQRQQRQLRLRRLERLQQLRLKQGSGGSGDGDGDGDDDVTTTRRSIDAGKHYTRRQWAGMRGSAAAAGYPSRFLLVRMIQTVNANLPWPLSAARDGLLSFADSAYHGGWLDIMFCCIPFPLLYILLVDCYRTYAYAASPPVPPAGGW